MQTLKKEVQQKSITQFQVTSDLLRNLYKFNLTPVTKLVLLELTTHLNENKNGSVVFPSAGYIAEVLGIGLTQTKKAINDLIEQGIIIKSKRNNVRGNYNKYLIRQAKIDFNTPENENRYIYTQKNINGQKTANKPSENRLLKRSDSELFMIRTNKNEQIKNNGVKNLSVENTSKNLLGGNVYFNREQQIVNSESDLILRAYAIKHGAKNVDAYVNTLKQSKSAENIIREYKRKKFINQNRFTITEILKEKHEIEKQNSVSCETSTMFVEWGIKHGIKK